MNGIDIVSALCLPPECRVDQRVPKKLLIENGAPTAADKRQINEGIEEIMWLAALKPTTIGVPEYRDTAREYLEIAVLSLALRPGAKAGRLTELMHRAIPYPMVLITRQSDTVVLSMAHKRWSQGEAGKMVLDDGIVACQLNEEVMCDNLSSLSLTEQPQSHLFALYQGWIDTTQAFLAAVVTGKFSKHEDAKKASDRAKALLEYDRLVQEIAQLRSKASRESQMNRRVDLNLQIKGLEALLTETIRRME